MKTTRHIGIREAKAHFSQLLRDVRLGRECIITERGKPVARLVPATAAHGTLEDRLRRLESAGVIERRTHYSLLPDPLPIPDGLAQQMLTDDREA